MHFSKTLVAVLLAAFATAQDMSEDSTATNSSSSDSPSTTSSGSAPEGSVMVHVIKVGSANGSLTFSPDNLKAEVGDMVQFHFWPKNHSIAQANFDKGCAPKEDGGFFSGFMPVAESDTEMPVFTMEIKDDKPIWYYCPQARHCQMGMVGVINQAEGQEERTLEKWKASCASAEENIVPAQATTGSSDGSSGSDDSSSSGGSSSSDNSGSSGSDDSGSGTDTSTATSGSSGAEETSNSTVTAGASTTFTTATKSGIAVILAAIVSAMLL